MMPQYDMLFLISLIFVNKSCKKLEKVLIWVMLELVTLAELIALQGNMMKFVVVFL